MQHEQDLRLEGKKQASKLLHPKAHVITISTKPIFLYTKLLRCADVFVLLPHVRNKAKTPNFYFRLLVLKEMPSAQFSFILKTI
jgi:hypothetical protein